MARLTSKRACVAAVVLLASGCTGELPGLNPSAAWQSPGGGRSQGHYEAGKWQLAEGLLGLALENFKAALASDPHSVEILNAVGASYDRLGRYDLARRYYMQALAMAPNAAQTLNNIGYSHVLQHDYDHARTYLEKAAAAAEGTDYGLVIAGNLTIAGVERRGQSASRADPQPPADAGGEQRQSRALGVWLQRLGEKVYELITRPSPRAAVAVARLPRAVGIVPLGDQSDREGVEEFLRDASFLVEDLVTDWSPKAVGAPSHGGKPAEPRKALVEVSNGAGRRYLAADLGRYLASKDMDVARITNDASFANQKTVIYYRDGYLPHARDVARLLPLPVELESVEEQYGDIRIRLGHDILEFDRDFTPIYEEI
jgi:tetratricopeptide (TPR) repeat protein